MKESNWFVSSEGEGLSATLGGAAIIGAVPAIQYLAGLIGLTIGENEIAQLVGNLVTGLGGFILAFGVIRKIFNSRRA